MTARQLRKTKLWRSNHGATIPLNGKKKSTAAKKRAAKMAEEELVKQKGRVVDAIKLEKEAKEEGIWIQEKIDEI